MWLHVDAAYGGAAALLPEMRPLFAGWERADSIVVNPHKWMCTPFDASLLLFRSPEVFRAAFSLVPEYLRTADTGGRAQLQRVRRAAGAPLPRLKVWFLLRWFGAEGMAERAARAPAPGPRAWPRVDADPDWERLAPVPLATVCLRYRGSPWGPRAWTPINQAILDRVNASGAIFLSHTRLRGPLHDPGLDREPAHDGRARGPLLGAAAGGR